MLHHRLVREPVSEDARHGLPYPPVPGRAASLSRYAVLCAAEIDGVLLDGTPESVEFVDGLILGFRRRRQPVSQIGPRVYALGCYVGELLVAKGQAKWEAPGQLAGRISLARMGLRLANGSRIGPVDQAFALLKNGQKDSLVGFYVAALEQVQQISAGT